MGREPVYDPVPVLPVLPVVLALPVGVVLPVGRGGGTGSKGLHVSQGSYELPLSHGRGGSQGGFGAGLSAGEHGNAESELKNLSISSDCFNLSQIGVKLP